MFPQQKWYDNSVHDDKFNVIAMTRFLIFVFQPKIQKGKAPEKVIHPYSRKAAYLAREESRLKRKERCVNNRKQAEKEQ